MNPSLLNITGEHIGKLLTRGAVAVPALNIEQLLHIVQCSHGKEFTWRERLTSTNVEQNFLGFDAFEPGDPFLELAHETAIRLERVFDRMVTQPIEFNDFSLQLYPISEAGQSFAISPHRDHKNCIGLIAVYVLAGQAPFCVCDDRMGTNSIEISARPGYLILMRGHGFNASENRPFHYVGRVTEERLTFGMRQTVDRASLPRVTQSIATTMK